MNRGAAVAVPAAASALQGDEALLGQLVDGVGGAFAGVARVLDAAVGHLVGAEGRDLVDQDAAELERAARPPVPRPMSRVKTPAWRPNLESLAISSASPKSE